MSQQGYPGPRKTASKRQLGNKKKEEWRGGWREGEEEEMRREEDSGYACALNLSLTQNLNKLSCAFCPASNSELLICKLITMMELPHPI